MKKFKPIDTALIFNFINCFLMMLFIWIVMSANFNGAYPIFIATCFFCTLSILGITLNLIVLFTLRPRKKSLFIGFSLAIICYLMALVSNSLLITALVLLIVTVVLTLP